MTFLGHLRRSRRLSRSVFALFVLACLQTMMVPCVMAAGVMTRNVVSHSASGQVQQAASMDMQSDMTDCIYCPHTASDQSHSDTHGCAYPHDVQNNDNPHQFQIEHLTHVTWIHSSPLTVTISLDNDAAPPRYFAVPIAQRSLTLTYGVQLK